MNKKHLNIFLIVLMLMIWTGVVKKFFWSHEEESSQFSDLNHSDGLTLVTKKDSLIFNVENKRPFAVSVYKEKKTVTPKSEPNIRLSNFSNFVKNNPEPWPELTYHGYVKNENNAFKLVLLKINGKLTRIKENEKIAGFFIEKVKKDSIILRRGQETKIVKKNQ